MRVYVACDHGGYVLKFRIIQKFKKVDSEFEFEDLGPYELNENDDYPDYVLRVVKKIRKDPGSFGILICRSGVGVSIAANKFKGIYAALCFGEKHAEIAREHCNANILCLDSEYTNDDLHYRIIEKFLVTKFQGMDTRYGRRIKKILEFEESE